MTDRDTDRFRERFSEIGTGLVLDKTDRSTLPSVDGLVLDTRFDVSQLESFATPPVEITGIAGKVRPEGLEGLRLEADLGKLDEGVRRIHEQQRNERIRNLLEEAQRRINAEQYQSAIQSLDEALGIDPVSAQVLFLKGYCLFRLDQFDPAIEVLDQSRRYARDPEIVLLVMILKAACMRGATEQIEAQLQDLIEKKRFDRALDLIERELRRQPSNIALLYHRCGVLFLMGRVPQAKQAAQDAMQRVGRENAGLFQELLNGIILQENQHHLEAIRLAIRRGDLIRAQSQLESCRGVLAGQVLYEALRSYLGERNPRGFVRSIFSSEKIKPLTHSSRQKFLLWLLAEELNEGTRAMGADNYDQAADIFEQAEIIDDRCSVICFMHGLAMFRQFEQAVKNEKTRPDLDRTIELLGEISKWVERAYPDPVVGQQSKNLGMVAGNYHSQLEQVAHERARRERETKPINDLIQDFNTFMEGLSGGIGSVQDLEKAEKKFRDLRQRAERLQRECAGTEGRDVLRQIISAIDNHLKQLTSLHDEIREGETVSHCVTMFNTLMQYYEKNPIRSFDQLRNARSAMQTLRQQVTEARAKVRQGSRSSQVLNQLEEAIRNVERQLNV